MYGTFRDHLKKELAGIEENGLYKKERILTTEQGAVVKVSTGEEVIFAPYRH
jgi:glycine C-acetyltransferase